MSLLPLPSVGDACCSSLRDRRRKQTQRIIHESAVDLTMRQGPDRTTIDQIAALAGVSVRTVFGYYGTKEDAILGLVAPLVAPEAVSWFVSQGVRPQLMERTIALLTSILRSMNIHDIDVGRRRTMLQAHPELLQRLQTRISDASELLEKVLAQLPDGPELPAGHRNSLRFAASAVVQGAFVQTRYTRFPTESDIEKALQIHRGILCI